METRDGKKTAAVVGAGLGGISAAITLAQAGYKVTVFEQNTHAGGKLNELRREGYTFDLGPSILTLPHIFERLFSGSGRKLSDYVSLRPLRPHWRNFFEDKTVFDLLPEPEGLAKELNRLRPGLAAEFQAFLAYAGRQYDMINSGYFEKGIDTIGEFLRSYGLSALFKFDYLRTMHQGVRRYIKEPHLAEVMDFFIKYVGSSPYDAPGFMNCLSIIQFRHDLWYVDGGMYNLARGLQRLAEEIGVAFHLNTRIAALPRENRRVTGVTTARGDFFPADVVVSNMEVIPAYRDLLQESPRFLKSLRRFAPACSGLVLDIGVNRRYPQLAHHNFFYSGNQRRHFRSVFHDKKIPEDPTLYVVAASRTNPAVAPPGCENLKILPHIPHLPANGPAPDPLHYLALRDRVLDKLERMGLTDLRRHIRVEHMLTPPDIQANYLSHCGAIYGVVAERKRNFAFKAPKQSSLYDNLFFVGGSVNPGGGMPMVVLSGQKAVESIAAWERREGISGQDGCGR